MKIFLSALESFGIPICDHFGQQLKWNLMSFYHLKQPVFERVLACSDEMLIDSGAHSFQKGKTVDWVEYTKKYAAWIKENDCPKIIGYFEMDVDNAIGYERVLYLRSILESVSDKIIPVWHKNRGIDEYKKMCQQYAGKIVAITGFRNEDIKDDQYIMFLKYAKKHGCKVHCLGMTRKDILNKVPFDYVDSSSWLQRAVFSKVGNKRVKSSFTRENLRTVVFANYQAGMEMQRHYHRKWGHLNE